MNQTGFDFSTPALVPVDPNLHPEDKDRLRGAALAMYLRLKHGGPATEQQLRLAGAGSIVLHDRIRRAAIAKAEGR